MVRAGMARSGKAAMKRMTIAQMSGNLAMQLLAAETVLDEDACEISDVRIKRINYVMKDAEILGIDIHMSTGQVFRALVTEPEPNP
jgi:hypothetical protein